MPTPDLRPHPSNQVRAGEQDPRLDAWANRITDDPSTDGGIPTAATLRISHGEREVAAVTVDAYLAPHIRPIKWVWDATCEVRGPGLSSKDKKRLEPLFLRLYGRVPVKLYLHRYVAMLESLRRTYRGKHVKRIGIVGRKDPRDYRFCAIDPNYEFYDTPTKKSAVIISPQQLSVSEWWKNLKKNIQEKVALGYYSFPPTLADEIFRTADVQIALGTYKSVKELAATWEREDDERDDESAEEEEIPNLLMMDDAEYDQWLQNYESDHANYEISA